MRAKREQTRRYAGCGRSAESMLQNRKWKTVPEAERAGGGGGLAVRGLAGACCPLVRCRMRGLDRNTGAHTCCASEILGSWLDMWIPGTSLVEQWLRIRLPMQGTWVQSLAREDPTC